MNHSHAIDWKYPEYPQQKTSANAQKSIFHMQAHLLEFEDLLKSEITNMEHDTNAAVNALVPVGRESAADPDLKASLLDLLKSVQDCHAQLGTVRKFIHDTIVQPYLNPVARN
jgi:hypothetical protein